MIIDPSIFFWSNDCSTIKKQSTAINFDYLTKLECASSSQVKIGYLAMQRMIDSLSSTRSIIKFL